MDRARVRHVSVGFDCHCVLRTLRARKASIAITTVPPIPPAAPLTVGSRSRMRLDSQPEKGTLPTAVLARMHLRGGCRNPFEHAPVLRHLVKLTSRYQRSISGTRQKTRLMPSGS